MKINSTKNYKDIPMRRKLHSAKPNVSDSSDIEVSIISNYVSDKKNINST